MLDFLMTNVWVIIAIVASVTTIITEAINKKLKPNGVWKQVISWVVAVALTVGTYFAGTYEYGDCPIVTVPLAGVATGLVANGLYDVPTLKEWIKTFVSLFYPNVA